MSSGEISQEWLLTAFYLYRTVHSLNLTAMSYPNLNLLKEQNTSITLNLHTLKSYKEVLRHILFLELKKQFNFDKDANFGNITGLNRKYILSISDTKLMATHNQPAYINFCQSFDFSTQFIFSSFLAENLKFGKQNR